jgi:transcription antitermination factor NusG
MARFNIGDRVRIRSNENTPFAGLEAVVQEVRPHARVSTLDVYIVVFAWGEQHSFYEVQLESLRPAPSSGLNPQEA